MKLRILLTTLALLGSNAAFAAVTGTPGQCGDGFHIWDLNCDGKLDYDESIASGEAHRTRMAQESLPVSRTRLPEPSEAGYPEAPQTTGSWQKVSTSATKVAEAGVYSTLLAPSAVGTACAQGTKGLILATTTTTECSRENSHGACLGYTTVTNVNYTQGYKAECL